MSKSAESVVASMRRLAAHDEGQDLLEYGLLVSLIATFLIGSVNLVGDQVNGVWWAAIAAARF